MSKPVTYVNPPSAPPVAGLYSHVAIAAPGSRFAFIAGQVAMNAEGQIVAPGDCAAQVPVVFDNIERILKDIGAGFGDVVELTAYIVGPQSREAWFSARGAVYQRIFPDKQYPPTTLLVISGLARPEMMVEVSAIVRLPG